MSVLLVLLLSVFCAVLRNGLGAAVVVQRYKKPSEQNQDLWLDVPELWSTDGYSSGLHGVVG